MTRTFSKAYGISGLRVAYIYAPLAIAEKLKDGSRPLPKVHMILKNRITQYMGPASAYNTVLSAIDRDVKALMKSNSDIFTFDNIDFSIVEVRDFQTTGVVASARGCPFFNLTSGRLDLLGQRVQVKEEYRLNCIQYIQEIISKGLPKL